MKSLWFQNLCVDLGVNAPVLICYVGGQHHVTGGERPHMNLTIDYKKKVDEKFTSCKAKIPGNFWRMNCFRRVTSTFPGMVWSRMRQEALMWNVIEKFFFLLHTWLGGHKSRWVWGCTPLTLWGQCNCCTLPQSSANVEHSKQIK